MEGVGTPIKESVDSPSTTPPSTPSHHRSRKEKLVLRSFSTETDESMEPRILSHEEYFGTGSRGRRSGSRTRRTVSAPVSGLVAGTTGEDGLTQEGEEEEDGEEEELMEIADEEPLPPSVTATLAALKAGDVGPDEDETLEKESEESVSMSVSGSSLSHQVPTGKKKRKRRWWKKPREVVENELRELREKGKTTTSRRSRSLVGRKSRMGYSYQSYRSKSVSTATYAHARRAGQSGSGKSAENLLPVKAVASPPKKVTVITLGEGSPHPKPVSSPQPKLSPYKVPHKVREVESSCIVQGINESEKDDVQLMEEEGKFPAPPTPPPPPVSSTTEPEAMGSAAQPSSAPLFLGKEYQRGLAQVVGVMRQRLFACQDGSLAFTLPDLCKENLAYIATTVASHPGTKEGEEDGNGELVGMKRKLLRKNNNLLAELNGNGTEFSTRIVSSLVSKEEEQMLGITEEELDVFKELLKFKEDSGKFMVTDEEQELMNIWLGLMTAELKEHELRRKVHERLEGQVDKGAKTGKKLVSVTPVVLHSQERQLLPDWAHMGVDELAKLIASQPLNKKNIGKELYMRRLRSGKEIPMKRHKNGSTSNLGTTVPHTNIEDLNIESPVIKRARLLRSGKEVPYNRDRIGCYSFTSGEEFCKFQIPGNLGELTGVPVIDDSSSSASSKASSDDSGFSLPVSPPKGSTPTTSTTAAGSPGNSQKSAPYPASPTPSSVPQHGAVPMSPSSPLGRMRYSRQKHAAICPPFENNHCSFPGHFCSYSRAPNSRFCIQHVEEGATLSFIKCKYVKGSRECGRYIPTSATQSIFCDTHALAIANARLKFERQLGKTPNPLPHFLKNLRMNLDRVEGKVMEKDGQGGLTVRKDFLLDEREAINPSDSEEEEYEELVGDEGVAAFLRREKDEGGGEEEDVDIEDYADTPVDPNQPDYGSLKNAGHFTVEECVKMSLTSMRQQRTTLDRLLDLARKEYIQGWKTYKQDLTSLKHKKVPFTTDPRNISTSSGALTDEEIQRELAAANFTRAVLGHRRNIGPRELLRRQIMLKRMESMDGLRQAGTSTSAERKEDKRFRYRKEREGRPTLCMFGTGTREKCGERVVPLTKFCFKHITQDKTQQLYVPCNFRLGPDPDDLCTTPVLSELGKFGCNLHSLPILPKDAPDSFTRKSKVEASLETLMEELSSGEEGEEEASEETDLVKEMEQLVGDEMVDMDHFKDVLSNVQGKGIYMTDSEESEDTDEEDS